MIVTTIIMVESTLAKTTSDGDERLRDQACSADKKTADFSRRRQRRGVIGLDAAAVQDANPRSGSLSKSGHQQPANLAMHPRDLCGRCVVAGSNGPHRFVSDIDVVYSISSCPLQRDAQLARDGL